MSRKELLLQGGRFRTPKLHAGNGEGRANHSGFLIIRLSSQVAVGDARNLMELAKKRKLQGLSQILDQFDLSSSRPLIRSLPADEILELERQASKTALPPLRSLTSYWRVDVRHRPEEMKELVERLNRLVEVDLAYPELPVHEPAVNAADDTYAVDQEYLDPAPIGIDARWAWTQPNGEGAGIGVVDLEQGWFLTHEDLVAKSPSLIYGDNRDGVGMYVGNHGTAVLGEMVGVDNSLGVVGIAPAVTSVRVTSHYDAGTDTNLHVADAILAAIPVMNAGDLLLLEVQRGWDPYPTEIDDGDFDAIRLATAHGIIVVEAAGNGDNDLDAYTDGGGNQIFNRATADFRESGAIMVGASESALPHDKAWFSNFGSRVDCYAWGENVVTCGYGDLDAGTGNDSSYTDTFGGTSSASPIVTGAGLVLQGMYEASSGTRLSPGQMRSLLSDPATGTAQGAGGNIGVMPNLRGIIENTLGLVPDIYLRDAVSDTGAIPFGGGISASPDVIVRPSTVADPAASFGEGSGTENSNTLGYEVEAGQDNFLYVRMKNRGMSAANGVTARVFWSEVATLVTPDMWNEIGFTAPVNVPQGDTLVVAGPLTWPKSEIPGTGHYCFVAMLDHAQDPAPPIPPGPPAFDWNGFRDYIRNHNNVTWRNFNVVDALPDPSGDPAEFPFLIAGSPDRSRIFDLEIFQKFPPGAELWLEVPMALARKLTRGKLWPIKVDEKRKLARMRLPSERTISFCGVRLAGKGRYPSRFLVRGAKGMERGGHQFGIRQIYDDQEVGRVTWQFHRRREEERCP